jgi:hypothetical protein
MGDPKVSRVFGWEWLVEMNYRLSNENYRLAALIEDTNGYIAKAFTAYEAKKNRNWDLNTVNICNALLSSSWKHFNYSSGFIWVNSYLEPQKAELYLHLILRRLSNYSYNGSIPVFYEVQ